MITDPYFYLVAIPAIMIYGISKGGFAGGLGVIAVPLMALVISPLQAAAILLPILCAMDLVALWTFRGQWVWPELKLIIPASFIGIASGTLLFSEMSPAIILLLLGTISIVFTLHHWLQHLRSGSARQKNFGPVIGIMAAAISGFTSFVAHAGGPPLGMYLLRRGLDKTAFVATTAVFFAVANYVKLVPYAWLGQLDASNLKTSLALMILAPISILLGFWLHKRVSQEFFFKFVYGSLFFVGLKLTWDGISGL
ncbi:MAG: sulfite exporter TauE/SafE family protein [Woeseiaceae bacterium]|nr:sulfite exporter TauE/SafE family protein [Woeseiaceae bacterium]